VLDPNTGKPRSAYFNFTRDPDNPFVTNARLCMRNVASFNNVGDDTRWTPMVDQTGAGGPDDMDFAGGMVDFHRFFTYIDPLTGRTRIILAGDQGVFSGVDRGDGHMDPGIGSATEPATSRHGNLQITHFYYGAVPPGLRAADVAGPLFYGMAQDNGFPESVPNILTTENLDWFGPLGDGTGGATDQQGPGPGYKYRGPATIPV